MAPSNEQEKGLGAMGTAYTSRPWSVGPNGREGGVGRPIGGVGRRGPWSADQGRGSADPPPLPGGPSSALWVLLWVIVHLLVGSLVFVHDMWVRCCSGMRI